MSLRAIKTGRIRNASGDGWTRYAIFHRDEVLRRFGRTADADPKFLIQELTDWGPHYGGPGRAFGETPEIYFSGSKVIVVQHGGYDV